MSRKAAASCSKCGRPIRKGDIVMQEVWATAEEVVNGRRMASPYLGFILHSRCLPEWRREREARHYDYQTRVAAKHPTAHWKLDDPAGSSTATDSSGHGYIATIRGETR